MSVINTRERLWGGRKMCIEEQVIYEKLAGITPINYTDNQTTNGKHIENKMDESDSQVEIVDYIAEIIGRISTMERTRQNYAYRPIYSRRGLAGGVIIFCKRVIRKLLKWYIEPICFQQTEFNNAVTPAIGRLCELQQLTSTQQASLSEKAEKEQQQVRIAIEQMRTELLSAHQEKMRETEAQIEALKKAMDSYREDTRFMKETILRQSGLLKVICAENASLRKKLSVIASLEQKNRETASLVNANGRRLDRLDEQMSVLREAGAFISSDSEENIVRRSVSQSGEDAIIAYLLNFLGRSLSDCTYLDLGANHAKYLSNTFYFYQKGARGVLVEANPQLIGELKLFRGGDTILNKCVSSQSGNKIPFYVMSGDGLSTSDRNEAEAAIIENPALSIDAVVEVETITVSELLHHYFDGAPTLMNIDIEGEEMNVLRSIDFEAYRPLIISIETIPYRRHLVIEEKREEIVAFMQAVGYTEYAFTGINSIFLDKRGLYIPLQEDTKESKEDSFGV